MSMFSAYQSRIDAVGSTKRDAKFRRASRYIRDNLVDNLSYFSAEINGVAQEVAVINTDNLNEKFIYSLPGEDIVSGSLVEWMNNRWLVTEEDAANQLYTRAKMIQCNYLLRWIDDDSVIHEQWCVIEDGTKYLTGQYEDRNFFITRGDSRLGMIIAKNEYTTKMKRGCRFLIDDEDSETMLAYELTKPFKLSGVYNGTGIFKFVLQEVNTTDDDNQELRVADYYKLFPRPETGEPSPELVINPETNRTENGKKVWL